MAGDGGDDGEETEVRENLRRAELKSLQYWAGRLRRDGLMILFENKVINGFG